MNVARSIFAITLLLGSAAAAACGDSSDRSRASPGASADASSDSSSGSPSPSPDAAPSNDATDEADAADPCAAENARADMPPTHLRCTGLYTDFASKTLAANARAYKPGATFFSDGLDKSRWVMLPANTRIDTSDMDTWSFPTNTKFWKEFRMGGKRIETRFYSKTGPAIPCDAGACATWVWTTYRWSDDESDAVRLVDGQKNVNGTSYEIPAESQCDLCHAGHADKALGFEALNLGLPGATGVTLAVLKSEGRLTAPPRADGYMLPEDATGKARAPLAWLHVNCGTACHNGSDSAYAQYTGLYMRVRTADLLRPDGGAAAVTDLDVWKTAVGLPPKQLTDFANAGYLLIDPGNVSKSLIPLLAGTRGVQGIPAMPPIASHVVDDAGVASVADWIAGMRDGGDGGSASDAGAPDASDAATDAGSD